MEESSVFKPWAFSQAAGSCGVSGGFTVTRIIDQYFTLGGIPLVNGSLHFPAETLFGRD